MVIASHMQMPIIRMSLTHVILTVLVMSAGLILPLVRDQNGAAGSNELASVLLYLHGRYWILALILFILVTIDAIRISHRTAGPMYRMARVMRETARGQFSGTVRLRKRDYLHHEADALNELLAYTQSLRADAKAASARLDEYLAAHNEAFEEGRLEGIEEARDLLRRELGQHETASSDEGAIPHSSRTEAK